MDMADYKHPGNITEFNPRAASPPSYASTDHNSRWASLHHGSRAQFSADPSQPDPSLHAGAPRWWVSPSSTFTPSAVYGGDHQLPTGLEPVYHYQVGLHDTGVAPGRFAADFNRNNPYSDTAPRSPSASWRHLQHRQPENPVCSSNADDWSCNGSFPARPAATSYPQATRTSTCDQERAGAHPVFPDQHLPPAYPVVQEPTRSYCFPQLPSANRPPVHPSYGGAGTFKVGDEGRYGWANADHQVRNVGRSQSMRALFEENAALRRALISMRRGSLFALQGPDHVILDHGEQDRYIVSDVAEGRALSMRERGRWAAAQAAAAAGEVVGAGADGNCYMWADTPRRAWAAPAAGQQQPLQSGASMFRHHRAAYHPSIGWEDAAAEHPLFSYGGPCGGWPEEFINSSRSADNSYWGDGRDESGAPGPDELGMGGGTSLKQLLVEADGGGMMSRHKWRRRGKKKLASPGYEEAGGKPATEEEGGGQLCAMCGGKLSRHAEGVVGKKLGSGLPLSLCAACHPQAAASLPQSTMRSPPVSTAQVRQHVGTAFFMACRPNPNAQEPDEMKYAPKKVKPAKKRNIVELCRQFVGLATGKPSDANN